MILILKKMVFLLLFISFSLYANSPDDLINKAQKSLDNQQYSSALIHLKVATKDYPNNIDIRLELIKFFIYTGQGLLAQTEIDKAIRLKASPKQITILQAKAQLLQGEYDLITNGFNFIDLPQNDIARIRSIQGHAFFAKQDFKNARLMFQRAYLLDSSSIEVQLGQARLYKIDGNLTQEKNLIESLLTQFPNHPEVLIISSEFYRSTNQFEKSLKLLEQASKIQDSNVNIWFGKVRSYIALEDYEKAKSEIQIVLTNFPEHQVGNYLLAVIAFEQKDYSRAKSAIDIVIKGKKRNFEAFKLLGIIQFHQNNFSEAEKNLIKFLKHNTNDIQAQKTLAAIYLKRKQGVLALDTLQKLIPTNDPYIYSMLANTYQLIGNTDKSQFYLKKSLALAPNNEIIKNQYQKTKIESGETLTIEFKDLKYENFLAKGHIPVLNLIRLKDYEKASEILNGYLIKSPNSGLLHYLKGTIALQQKHFEEAKSSFQKSLKFNPKLVESKISLAKLSLVENNHREAEKLFREALKIQPNNDQALVSLAGIFHRRGDDGEMLNWLNKSRKHNKASLASREVLVDYYKKKNNMAKAVEISKEMIDIQPENIPLLIKHADNLKLFKKTDLAVEIYKKILQLKPNDPAIWYGLGKMQKYDNDIEESYKSFEKFLSLRPNSFIASAVLTKYDISNKQLNKALKRAKSLVKKHPKNADSYDTLGDVYIALKQPKLAIKQYQKSVDIRFNDQSYIKLFSAYNRDHQEHKAIHLLEDWVKEFPDSINLKEVLAISFQRLGNYKEAQKLYEEIIQLVKNEDRIFNNLALVSLKLKSPMSMEYADIAYNLNNKNALNLDTLGWVHLKNDNLSEALKYLSKAVELSPENPDFRYHLAEALYQANEIQEAKSQLALVIEIEGVFNNRKAARALFNKIK